MPNYPECEEAVKEQRLSDALERVASRIGQIKENLDINLPKNGSSPTTMSDKVSCYITVLGYFEEDLDQIVKVTRRL